MTLEEAKKQIQAQANAQWEEFKKTGSSLHQGFALGGEDALEILDEVDAEPVGNPDKLTLTELARELRKIFRFKYLTVSPYREEVLLWWDKPESDGFYWWATETCTQVAFYSAVLSVPIDLSEYKDADGNIDYSKCIVEVE